MKGYIHVGAQLDARGALIPHPRAKKYPKAEPDTDPQLPLGVGHWFRVWRRCLVRYGPGQRRDEERATSNVRRTWRPLIPSGWGGVGQMTR